MAVLGISPGVVAAHRGAIRAFGGAARSAIGIKLAHAEHRNDRRLHVPAVGTTAAPSSRIPFGGFWHDLVVGTREWLAGWDPRWSRVLAEAEIGNARAALVDTNGDGRELWFGLDVRVPPSGWTVALDWDDAGRHQPVRSVNDVDIVFGWGIGQPGEYKAFDYDGAAFRVRVNRGGWWVLLASATRDLIDTDTP